MGRCERRACSITTSQCALVTDGEAGRDTEILRSGPLAVVARPASCQLCWATIALREPRTSRLRDTRPECVTACEHGGGGAGKSEVRAL